MPLETVMDQGLVIDRSLDCAVAFDVLEHIPDYPKYLEAISRSLRVGGKVYYYAPFGHSEPSHMDDAHGLLRVAASLGLKQHPALGIVSCLVKA